MEHPLPRLLTFGQTAYYQAYRRRSVQKVLHHLYRHLGRYCHRYMHITSRRRKTQGTETTGTRVGGLEMNSILTDVP